MKILISCIFAAGALHAQSDLEKILKGGEIILSGITVLKAAGGKDLNENGNIDKVCIKNRLTEKVSFVLTRKNDDGTLLIKEAVIPVDGRECLLDLPKGIYAYEITWPDKQVYKKGEYKFDASMTITLKD
jgi:hypothetical protein